MVPAATLTTPDPNMFSSTLGLTFSVLTDSVPVFVTTKLERFKNFADAPSAIVPERTVSDPVVLLAVPLRVIVFADELDMSSDAAPLICPL